MSFDLMVLVDQTDVNTQVRWIEKLRTIGIECNFPQSFVVGTQMESEVLVQCKLHPPLVNEPTSFEEFGFYFDAMEVDQENITDMVDATDDDSLKQKLQKMKSEIFFTSSAGRDDHALIVQCYAAATLADATSGILVDPQEFGAVHGQQVYEVAKHHCEHVISKSSKTTTNNTASSTATTNVQPAKPKGMSPTLIVLLILLFIAVKNLITK